MMTNMTEKTIYKKRRAKRKFLIPLYRAIRRRLKRKEEIIKMIGNVTVQKGE